MMIFLSAEFSSLGDRMKDAGIYAVLGLAIVLVVLALIWGVLAIFGVVFGREEKKNAQADNEKKEEIGTDPATAADKDDSAAVAAAVTAAVSLIFEEEAAASRRSPSSFRVVAFRRAGGSGPWCG